LSVTLFDEDLPVFSAIDELLLLLLALRLCFRKKLVAVFVMLVVPEKEVN